MAKLEYANSFHDLIVYRKARELFLAIFKLTERFPKKEDYSLTDQIRRSSRSIGAQIAEAWAKRQYESIFSVSLRIPMLNSRKPSTGSKLPLIVSTFLKKKQTNFLRNVLKLADC